MSGAKPSTASKGVGRAALWMGGWLSLMVIMAVAGREAMREMSVFQLMFVRSVVGLVLLWPLVKAAGGWAKVKSQVPQLHWLRNAVHYAAQYGWFVALGLISMAQLIAIEFTMPLWSGLLAVLILGERFTPVKLAAVALGLAGVVAIVNPASASWSIGHAIGLAAALGFAISVVLVKRITATDAPIAVSVWMGVIQGLVGLAPALYLWRWPSLGVWGWVLIVAVCGTYSHYCFAKALQLAEATVVVPIDFLRVPLMAGAGWAVYNEQVGWLTAFGMALILCGNSLNLLKSQPAARPASKPIEPTINSAAANTPPKT